MAKKKNPTIAYDLTLDSKGLIKGLKVAGQQFERVKDTTKKVNKETQSLKDTWDGVKKLAAGSGTWLGTMTADVGDLGEGLAEVGGKTGALLGAGAALTAIGLAAAGSVYAAVELFRSWRDLTLEAAELAHEIRMIDGKRLAEQLDAAKESSDALDHSFNVLKIRLAASLSPAFIETADEITSVINTLDILSKESVPRAAAAFITLMARGGPQGWWRELAKFGAVQTQFTKQVLAGEKLIEESEERALKLREKRKKADEDFLKQIETTARLAEKRMDQAQREAEELQRMMREIRSIKFKPFSDIVDDEVKFKEATKQIVNHTADGVEEIDALIADYDQALADSVEADIVRQQERKTQTIGMAVDTAQTLISLGQMVTDAAMTNLDTETEEGRKAALEIFNAQKALNITQALMNTALAVSAAATAGPPPWNAIPMAAAAAMGAAQVGMIAAQAPPAFAVGGMVADHGMIQASAGEGILSRSVVRGLGGQRGVDDANRRLGGGGSPIIVQHRYQHRVFGAFVQDHMQMRGPLADRLDKARKPGHSRRR